MAFITADELVDVPSATPLGAGQVVVTLFEEPSMALAEKSLFSE
ncbi:MAG TPA: hypothetical protein VGU25_00595 [Acidobacteriaceae bacterium]|nr:hypothetical protein [Acidobacteriaceae bacterium]